MTHLHGSRRTLNQPPFANGTSEGNSRTEPPRPPQSASPAELSADLDRREPKSERSQPETAPQADTPLVLAPLEAVRQLLVLDGDADFVQTLHQWLNRSTTPSYRIRCAATLDEGLTQLDRGRIDAILVSLSLSDSQGTATLVQLRDRAPQVPVLVLGDDNDGCGHDAAIEFGAQDYLLKPQCSLPLLLRAIAYSIERHRLQQRNHELRHRLEVRVRDRTETLEQVNADLREAANRDDLTGLYNRRAFLNCLNGAIHRLANDGDCQFAVLFLDLDRFKRVNDSFGHVAGDELLEAVAERLRHTLRPTDILARFGGDEFAILLDYIHQEADATLVTQRIADALKHPFSICGLEIALNTSIGIVVGNNAKMQADEFLRNADIALYRAKARGQGCYEVFDRPMYESQVLRLQLEADIRQGLKRHEFFLRYQPIWDAAKESVVGFEALIRWQHPTRGLVPPGEFVAVAEETGAIVAMDWWVMQQACHQVRQWQQQFPDCGDLFASVNFSSQQFLQPNFFERLDRVFEETGLARSSLKLEITESTLMSDSQATETVLSQLKRCGVQLGIDDFGTGYSSLSYLHRFPLDTLKVDRSFIMRLEEGGKHLEIVRAIVTLAHNLGMQAIAEGVETREQLHLLRRLGCETIQGYLLSKPLDVETATELLADRRQSPSA